MSTTTKRRTKRASKPKGPRAKALPSKVITCYVHGRPTELQKIEQQFYLANQYRNKLAQTELSRRRILNRVAGASCVYSSAKLAEAETAAETAEQALKDANAQARSRVDKAADRLEVRRLVARARRWEQIHNFIRKRAYARPEVQARTSKVEAAVRRLDWIWLERFRQQGLFWGTYLQVDLAMRDRKRGAPPSLAKQGTDGKIAVQLQPDQGLDVALAFLPKHKHINNIRIDAIPPEAWQTGKDPGDLPLGQRRRLRRTKIRMRVGNKPDVWTELNAYMHRPLPKGSKIKWVFLMRRRVGFRWIWGLRFVVSSAAGFQDPLCATSGEVGVDLGWRIMPSGLRVACWLGSDGQKGELQLPTEVYTAWDKADSLQSIRDRLFNEMVEELKVWLNRRKNQTALPDIPDWLKRSTETLPYWKSFYRLRDLQQRWKTLRWRLPERLRDTVPAHKQYSENGVVYELLDPVPHSEEIQIRLREWFRKDRHLHDWRMFQMRKAANKREEIFYRFAAILRRKYEKVKVEDVNWRELMARPEVSDEPEDNKHGARKYAREGSPGLLREILERTFAKSERVEAAMTTRPCAECNHLEEWDQSRLMHTCSNCLAQWDQDENAARHILASPPLPSRKKKTGAEDE